MDLFSYGSEYFWKQNYSKMLTFCLNTLGAILEEQVIVIGRKQE